MAAAPPLWGWGHPQRMLLAGITASWALALLVHARTEKGPTVPSTASLVVDLNEAPPSLLLALPGLGPTRVERILAARAEGPFASLDDLARRVKGIGPATIEGLRPYVRVGTPAEAGPTPTPSP